MATQQPQQATFAVKVGLAQMLKGGVIMVGGWCKGVFGMWLRSSM